MDSVLQSVSSGGRCPGFSSLRVCILIESLHLLFVRLVLVFPNLSQLLMTRTKEFPVALSPWDWVVYSIGCLSSFTTAKVSPSTAERNMRIIQLHGFSDLTYRYLHVCKLTPAMEAPHVGCPDRLFSCIYKSSCMRRYLVLRPSTGRPTPYLPQMMMPRTRRPIQLWVFTLYYLQLGA